MATSHGTFALILHSHLPYVLSHNRLEEEWLLEAVVESYLPLISCIERLTLLGISPQITIGMTPVLLEQLAAPTFPQLFLSYLDEKCRAAREDQRMFRPQKEDYFARLAGLWEEFYRRSSAFFDTHLSSNLIKVLRRLQRQGHIEILLRRYLRSATVAYGLVLRFLSDNCRRCHLRIADPDFTCIASLKSSNVADDGVPKPNDKRFAR